MEDSVLCSMCNAGNTGTPLCESCRDYHYTECKLCSGCQPAKNEMVELLRAKSNVDRLLGEPHSPRRVRESDGLGF